MQLRLPLLSVNEHATPMQPKAQRGRERGERSNSRARKQAAADENPALLMAAGLLASRTGECIAAEQAWAAQSKAQEHR